MYRVFNQNEELHITPDKWEKFYSQHTIVAAAGGVVINPQNEILMIYRLKRWDLPKGKCEQGESLEQTAIREVQEECSIDGLILKDKIMTTYHIYQLNKLNTLKETHWYLMRYDGTQKQFTPQKEEGIERAEFLPMHQILKVLPYSFSSIQSVFQQIQGIDYKLISRNSET
ncbi:MAG: NUDIX hydrolase [Bacteroidales bacterium]